MKLITKAIARQIPRLHAQAGKGESSLAFLKLFTPWSHWTWYVLEMDPETKDCFGLVQGLDTELGYFNLGELEKIEGPFGLAIERDIHFEPTPLSQLR